MEDSKFIVDKKSLFKSLLFRGVLPQVFFVMLLVLIHWSLISLWGYLNYDSNSAQKISLVSLLGGVIPVITYSLWGLRKVLLKTFSIFHEKVLKHWVNDFCDSLSDKLIRGEYLSKLESDNNSIFIQFSKVIIDKVERFPLLIQRIIKVILNRVGINNDLGNYIELVKEGNTSKISSSLNENLTKLLFQATDNLFPSWVTYLVPINSLLFIILWFI